MFTEDCVPRFQFCFNVFSSRCTDCRSLVNRAIEVQNPKQVRAELVTESAIFFQFQICKPAFLFDRISHELSDDLVRLPEWKSTQHKIVSEIAKAVRAMATAGALDAVTEEVIRDYVVRRKLLTRSTCSRMTDSSG